MCLLCTSNVLASKADVVKEMLTRASETSADGLQTLSQTVEGDIERLNCL